MMEAVKKTFDENGITIPYPQLDVHIKKDGDINDEKIAQEVAQQANKKKKTDK